MVAADVVVAMAAAVADGEVAAIFDELWRHSSWRLLIFTRTANVLK